MSFAAAKSTFVQLWLFVAFIGLGNAQETSRKSPQEYSISAPCGEDEFECQNQECIPSELLCDGRADCFDQSDETEFECSKPEFTCPEYAFRCKYGACIDQDLVCNGPIDCIADGSDEDTSGVCSLGSVPGGAAPASGQPPFAFPAQGEVGGQGYGGVVGGQGGTSFGGGGLQDPVSFNPPCWAPPPPNNGHFKLRQMSDNDVVEYVELLSPVLAIDSQLVYTCEPGYKIRGNPLVVCSPFGKWSRKPVCIEIKCRPLGSVSTTGNYIDVSGRETPCDAENPVLPKTRAKLSCRPGYRKEFNSFESETLECNGDGKWEPVPIRCVPVCGIASAGRNSLATRETTTNISTFPWHAALHVQGTALDNSEAVFRCDATVIQANLLLTTAQCVYDFILSWDPALGSSSKPLEILESYFITTGNIEPGSLPQDSQLIKKHLVKNVHTTCNYNGGSNIYAADIALIELHEPLEFSNTLLPVCLDELGSINRMLEARFYGSPTFNQIPRTTTVLNMPYSQCVTLYNATRNPFRVNDDKFCDSHNNGPNSCLKDVINDGGGLVFEANRFWYLIGIVSRVFSPDADRGQRICDRDFKLLYNKVSKQMTWIQQVISNLERLKYPPCSRYLPPFSKKPTTPAPLPASTSPTTIMTMTMTMTMPTTTPTPTTLMSSTVRPHVASRVKAGSCLVPGQPANGEWRLHQDFCESDVGCHPAEGTSTLEPGSQLVYSCAPGYRVEGNTDVYCRANGNWSSVPVCTEIKCNPLGSISTTATCSHFGEWVDCNFPVFPNTQAKVSCRSGYRAQMTESEIVECKTNGNWEPATPYCVPVCGATFGRSPLFVEREITAAAYPWHATLYVQKNTSMANGKEVRCGATLIQSNLLLTAAHCVYNDKIMTTEDPRKLFILMSNVHRHYDSPLHDLHTVRRGAVKNVYVHCNYQGLGGNYSADIALLELQEPFEFFNIQLHPACLDFSGYNAKVLGPGASGEFLGFGKTALGEPSDVLQSIRLPYVSQAQCQSSNIPLEKQVFITNDKFCAGYNNGTAICLGDGGGGLFVQIDGLWFVVGVVSVDLNKDLNNGEDTCDGNVFTLYTKVSDYMAWILDVMFHLERYKTYPQCSH